MSESTALAQFLDQVRLRGFQVSLLTTGEYRIAATQDTSLDRPRRLMLNQNLFDEYVGAAVRDWELPPGSTDRAEEVLSLMVVNLEAALASVDADGRNYLTELGLRRDASGTVHWYQIEDRAAESMKREGGSEFRWVAERPS